MSTSETPSAPPALASAVEAPEMASATLARIWTHPIKGLSALRVESGMLRPAGGLENDRLYAFAYADALAEVASARGASVPADDAPEGKMETVDSLDPSEVSALAKPLLLQQNDWPALGALALTFDATHEDIVITDARDPARTIRDNPETPAGRARLEGYMNAFLACETRAQGAHGKHAPRVRLVGGKSHATRFPDRSSADVTFVSAQTLAAIEKQFGAPIDERRYRINLIIDGMPAWSEETLVGKNLRIGNVLMTVKGPVRRCYNIDVNPDVGGRDISLLEWLKPNLGHVVVGYTALVQTPGDIAVGDAVTFP